MIKPTIGRVVWFWPYAPSLFGEFHFNGSLEQPCAAIVVAVWSDRCVNLVVYDHAGMSHSFGSVILVQDGDSKPERCCFCEWMPYQKGQAAKAEELEKQRSDRPGVG